jgi:Xaa-Pro aminopeptidase
MRTMHPSIMLGSYTLDRDRMPDDEFHLRMEEVRRLMDERGLDALMVYGDAPEHDALAHLSNYIPRMRWGMALFTRDGARLLCSMGTRDLPAMRTTTWIPEVYSGTGPEWKWFDDWVAKLKERDGHGDIGTIGFDRMTPALYEAVETSLGNRFRMVEAEDLVAGTAVHKRPRELSMMKSACEAVAAAASIFASEWQGGADPERAALAAERRARMMAAQDVRTLVSFDGGRTLSPFRGTFDTPTQSLAGYIAVKLAGYWADLFVTAGAPAAALAARVEAGLDAMIAASRPGTAASALHAAGTAALGGAALHPALGGSVGHGIGVSLHAGPEFRADEPAALEAGATYALQLGALGEDGTGAFASAIVHVGEDGTEVLARSPAAAAA